MYHTDYLLKRATLLTDRDRETRPKPQGYRPRRHIAWKTTDTKPEHCVPNASASDPDFVYAFVGDVTAGTPAATVAAMIASWTPDFVITPGGMWDATDSNTQANLDTNFGAYYGSFMFPYNGTIATSTIEVQKLYAALGAQDRYPDARLPIVDSFFNLPATNPANPGVSRGYYDAKLGPVHLFVIDSGYDPDQTTIAQADGNTAGSAQGLWMKQRMLSSNLRWKFAVSAFPPYSSASGFPVAGGFTNLQWPFDAYKVDAVISAQAHNYERLAVNGVPYLVTGTGGATLQGFGTILPSSLFQLSQYGALEAHSELRARVVPVVRP